MATTRLSPNVAELDRIAAEVDVAIAMLGEAGILQNPAQLHPQPPPPELTLEPSEYRGVRYQHVTFESGYRPQIELPGSTRWQATAANQTAHAYMLRHREPRPWIVQLHGFGMGARSDVIAMRALHFHRDLGLNVLQPVFPVHGPRSDGPETEEALTLDYLNTVHAMSQATWDVRQLFSWIEETEGQPIALHGVSMGGYLAALLAGLDDRVSCVISGVPTVDFAWVMNRHIPEDDRALVDERRLLGEKATTIHSVISPLTVKPLMPVDRRFVYAGVADRMATPGQAYRLWEHWDQPSVLWYRGAHVSFAWSREVRAFVDRALHSSGITV